MTRLEIARLFVFVREAQALGQNRGLRVEAIQHWSAGQFGDSWCAELATMVLDLEYQGKAPVPREQSCEDIRALCEAKGWLTTTPVEGDLFFYVNAAGRAHHIGFYVALDGDGITPVGLAGNTSADGKSDNGDRVAEHPLDAGNGGTIVYAHLPDAPSTD